MIRSDRHFPFLQRAFTSPSSPSLSDSLHRLSVPSSYLDLATLTTTAAGQAVTDGQQRGSMRTHFVLVPMMAQGHAIPMTDLARLLAMNGAQVSLVTTPVNASRMAGFVDSVEEAGLAVQLLKLPFPAAEHGLPDGCENIDMVPSKNLFRNFMEACAALQEPLTVRLREQRPPPSCIIADLMQWWTGDIARELGIPRLTFNGYCTFSSLVFARTYQ